MPANPCPECKSENTGFNPKKQLWVCKECWHEWVIENDRPHLRIFLSYGRDEYAVMAERVREDLKARGHEVWFDKEKLKEGGDWERYIEEGIDWAAREPATGRIVFVMTPHSVRRPDGYCLNELAKGLARSLKIVPVMLVWAEPPLSIYRLQYLDMQDSFRDGKDFVEGIYGRKLERLAEALERDRTDFEGAQGRLLKALQPIRFGADVQRLLRDFTGRKWVFAEVDRWLADPEGPKVFWITGAPGAGKSAIAAWLRDNRREVAAFHFCDIASEEKRDPVKLVASVAFQLSTQLPDYAARLSSLALEETLAEYHEAYTLFDKIIVQPLSDNFPEPDRRIVVLIDALDEATSQKRNEIVRLLAASADKTPSWLRFLVTSRPEPEILAAFSSHSPFVLDTSTEANRRDIAEFLRGRHPAVTEAQLAAILERSEGVFLYARHVSEEVLEGRLSLDRPDEFPRGLGAIYVRFFERQFQGELDYYEREITPLLYAILAAYEPLGLGFLQKCGDIEGRTELMRRLNRLGSLFPVLGEGDGATIRPFHRSLVDWITVNEASAPWFIDRGDGHRRLAEMGWRQFEAGPEGMDGYFLAWLPAHLAECREWDRAVAVLKDFRYLMARVKADQLERALVDYRNVKTLPPEARKRLEIEASFFGSKAHILRRGNEEWPEYKILLQLAVEHADDSPLTIGAERWLEEGKCDWKWLRRNQRVGHGTAGNCLAVFEGHTSSVNGAIIRPDGSMLSWSQDGTLRLWSAEGKQLGVLEGHTVPVFGALLRPDGSILSWSQDKTLRLWSAEGEPLGVLEGHTSSVGGALLRSDGSILSWTSNWDDSSDHTLRLWSAEGEPLAVLKGHTEGINGVLLRPDGSMLSWSESEYMFRLWSAEGEALGTLEGHTAEVNGALLRPDGSILSWSRDHTLRLWSAEGELLAVLDEHISGVNGALLRPDGSILSWSEDSTLRIWSTEGEPLGVLEGHTSEVNGALLRSDGSILSWSFDHTLRLWSEVGEPLGILKGHTAEVNSALLRSDGSILSWSFDKTFRFWSMEGEPLGVLEGHTFSVVGALLRTDGCILSWASQDNMLRLWNAESEPLGVLEGHTDRVKSAILHPDGIILSWSNDNTLRLWSAEGEPLDVLEGHTSSVDGALLRPDGSILSWSCWGDQTLRLWRAVGEPLAVLEGHTELVAGALVRPDGSIISWAHDNTLRLWSVDGEPLRILEGHSDGVDGALLRPDGSILSWSSGYDSIDHTLRLWSAEGEPLAVLRGHTDDVRHAILCQDGSILSCSADHTLRLWSVEGEPLGVLEGHTEGVLGALIRPDGSILSWSVDHTLRLWNAKGGSLGVLEGHTDSVWGAHLRPDGSILSQSRDKSRRLWSAEGEQIESFSVPEAVKRFPELASEDCHIGDWHAFATGGISGVSDVLNAQACYWQTESECCERHLFPDGRIVVTQDNGQVCFLRLHEGRQMIALDGTPIGPLPAIPLPEKSSLGVSHSKIEVSHNKIDGSHSTIGYNLQTQGDLDGALAEFRMDLGIMEGFATKNLANAKLRHDLMVCHNRIGGILESQGDLAGALAEFREGLAISGRLAALDPANADWQRGLGVSHDWIGVILEAQGDLAGALAEFREDLAISQRLAAQDPTNPGWRRDLGVSHSKIGGVLETQGLTVQAQESFQKSLTTFEGLSNPASPGSLFDHTAALAYMARIEQSLGQAEAAAALDREVANMEWRASVISGGFQNDAFPVIVGRLEGIFPACTPESQAAIALRCIPALAQRKSPDLITWLAMGTEVLGRLPTDHESAGLLRDLIRQQQGTP